MDTTNSIPKLEMICRFCLTQNNLSSISADDYLQIMICPTINIFDDEDAPACICDDCRRLIEHSHHFHRMCKRANKLLAQYQFTGVIPSPLEKPPPLTANVATCDAAINTTIMADDYATISTQTEESDFDAIVAYPISEDCASNEDEIDELPNSELDEEVYQEATDEFILSETSLMYEQCGADETLIVIEEEAALGDGENEVLTAESFQCQQCSLSFPLREARDAHMKRHERVRRFQCDICKKRFYTKKDLKQHETLHTGEKPYKCSLCDKGYTRKSSLDRHESKHGDIPKYLCVYCDKCFNNRDLLDEHIKAHETAQKFTCNICFKSFGLKKNLTRHAATHLQVHDCDHCNEKFPTQRKLEKHLLTHTEEEAMDAVEYFCEICEKSFSNSKKYNTHMSIHNLKEQKPLKCLYCHDVFYSREDYVLHTAVHSKENLICSLCLTQFHNVQNIDAEVDEHVKLHIKGDVYFCDFCNFMCLNETDLSLHTC